VDNKSKDRC